MLQYTSCGLRAVVAFSLLSKIHIYIYIIIIRSSLFVRLRLWTGNDLIVGLRVNQIELSHRDVSYNYHYIPRQRCIRYASLHWHVCVMTHISLIITYYSCNNTIQYRALLIQHHNSYSCLFSDSINATKPHWMSIWRQRSASTRTPLSLHISTFISQWYNAN